VLGLMLLMHNPAAALLGAGIVLCGLPVRWLLTRGEVGQPDAKVLSTEAD
jgi:hypothetical protein